MVPDWQLHNSPTWALSQFDYVIGKLEEEQYKALEEGIQKAVLGTEKYLKNGIDSAMNKFN